MLVLTRSSKTGPRIVRTEPGIRLVRTGVVYLNTALVNSATLHGRYRVELSQGEVRLVPDDDGFTLTPIAGRGAAQLSVSSYIDRSPIPFDNRFLPATVLAGGAIVATMEGES